MSVTPARAAGGRRVELLSAARTVAARDGLRGLTHRAVDREAGLPLGTCSAYLRTSHALRTALAEDVVAELTADVEDLARALSDPVPTRAEAVSLVHDLCGRWLRERTAYLVSLELGLAAARDPALATLLTQWRIRLVETVEQVVRRLDPSAAPPGPDAVTTVAEMLVAALDGVLAAALARPEAERDQALASWLGLLLDAVVPRPTARRLD